jgi:hypothetical protein
MIATSSGPRFPGLFNFRDLGGRPTVNGRVVRPGRLYRSDSIARVGPLDRAAVASSGLRTVIDLRRPTERAKNGHVKGSGLVVHEIDIQPFRWPKPILAHSDMPGFLADRYLEIAERALDGARPMGAALRVIADERAWPLVIQCAAGKDRTGVVTAVVLCLLGVADDVVADDFALSASSESRHRAWVTTFVDAGATIAPDGPRPTADELAALMRPHRSPTDGRTTNPAPREAMLDFLARLRHRHGSVQDYALSAGLPAEAVHRLAKQLTVPAPQATP